MKPNYICENHFRGSRVIQINIKMYGEQREPRRILPNLRYFAKFYRGDRSTKDKRCYVKAFKTKIIQIAVKYRHFCSFKVVHAGIIFYRHSGMTTQFLSFAFDPITRRFFLSNITSLLSVAGFKMAAYLGAYLVIISSILCIFSSFFR